MPMYRAFDRDLLRLVRSIQLVVQKSLEQGVRGFFTIGLNGCYFFSSTSISFQTQAARAPPTKGPTMNTQS